MSLERIDRKTLRLRPEEETRINNILKRAMDMEKGVLTDNSSVNPDHPDGREFCVSLAVFTVAIFLSFIIILFNAGFSLLFSLSFLKYLICFNILDYFYLLSIYFHPSFTFCLVFHPSCWYCFVLL